jgi:hypothetical protein
MQLPHFRHALNCAVVLLLAACSASDSTAPEERSSSDLQLLTVAANAPALAVTSTSFYAVRGKGAGVDLWYRARAGQHDSTKFMEFRLNGNSLDKRPDGSTIANGDSVRITVTVVDPVHLIVEFQPSGLRFAANDPARLKMFFSEVGDDLDHNGRVDGDDDNVSQKLSIWRQEAIGQPWVKVASAVVKSSKEVDADLSGFTGYALAY